MRFIGITGGIGAGKSEILHYIGERYKCEIYLADEVAHLVKQPGTRGYEELVKLLGTDAVAADGQIDKAVMADKIFARPELLEQVNGIIHLPSGNICCSVWNWPGIKGRRSFFSWKPLC